MHDGSVIVGLLKKTARKIGSVTRQWTRPQCVAVARDLVRSKRSLIAENALLRQQLIVARRQFKKAQLRRRDRVALLAWARLTGGWRDAILLVKPDTVLRWHRQGFKLFWRSKFKPRPPKISHETIVLIRRMARQNVLWGAERIRGELLKLGINHAKTTIQRYMPTDRPERWPGQTWVSFLANHAPEIWSCDFLQLYDWRFSSHLRVLHHRA